VLDKKCGIKAERIQKEIINHELKVGSANLNGLLRRPCYQPGSA